MTKRDSEELDPIEIIQNSRETYLVTEGGHALRVRVHSLSQQMQSPSVNVFGAQVDPLYARPVRMEIRAVVEAEVYDAGSATRSRESSRMRELENENALLREAIRLMNLGKIAP